MMTYTLRFCQHQNIHEQNTLVSLPDHEDFLSNHLRFASLVRFANYILAQGYSELCQPDEWHLLLIVKVFAMFDNLREYRVVHSLVHIPKYRENSYILSPI